MNERFKEVWLPWTLRVAALAAAACLVVAVLIAPWIADESEPSLWSLYANDVAVRRTSIFSALGLVATALIFFKPKPTPPRPGKPDTASHVAGA